MYNATIVFMDMVGFSKLAPATQKHLVEELTASVKTVVEPLLVEDGEPRLVALPTGDGMALGFLNCSGTDKTPLEWLIAVIEAAKDWGQRKQVGLRIGINCGDVEVIRDINGNRNLCGHAINDAQRVMDAANENGVLWSKAAVEHHFGKVMPAIGSPYEFREPVLVTVKHEIDMEVRQLVRTDTPAGWDDKPLEAQWKNSYLLSPQPWTSIEHLDHRWATARQVAMIHMNGMIFRDQRWKLCSGGPHQRPTDVALELQLAAEPFGQDLEHLLVFIPTEERYEAWVKENWTGDFEPYANCVTFWTGYARKLCRDRVQLLKDRQSDASQLTCQVRRYPTLGFFLYYFDWSSPGGLIRGVPHLWGVNFRHSSNFEIKWRGKSKPPVFNEYVRGLHNLQAQSELLYSGYVNALGSLVEER